MTKSVQVDPFVFFCLKCGHDKSLGDVLQHEAKTKLNNINPIVEQLTKDKVTQKDVYKFLLDGLNQACQNGIDMERQRIKAGYEKELAKFRERIYQFRSKEPGYVFMNATLIEFDTNIKKVFEK
jgi:hypothetical protein